MKLLLHTCCGPCTVYPLEQLRQKDFNVMGFFYRHNIHPLLECIKREETLKDFAKKENLKMIWQEGYEIEEFLRKAAFRESNRCEICYFDRLSATVKLAKRGKFEYFSSTLLYSKFQNHKKIIDIATALGKQHGVKFYYEDFREGWSEGIEKSKDMEMYRQQYCGCIFSEKERFIKYADKIHARD
jgi:predicted adenine nucleotide alpha hydrolase (AANH) superfamily ATPase